MAAGSTYSTIATTTLGSAQSSYTFTSIPGTYTDLVLVMNAATTHTISTFVYMRFNSDSGTNYSVTEIYGDGTSALSGQSTNRSRGWLGYDIGMSATLGENISIANIMNYSNTSTNKTWLSRFNRAGGSYDYPGTNASAGLWRNTAAITSVEIRSSRGDVDYNFAIGSTFTLYGIAAA
jgi:hypothetical protein